MSIGSEINAPRTALAVRIALIKEYFRRGDAGDPRHVIDEVELRFPKSGRSSGKAAMVVLAQGLLGQPGRLKHCPDDYTYIADGDFVLAQVWESGKPRDGRRAA